MNRDDLDPLLDDALQTACHFLEKNGEFLAFGVVLTSVGERRHIEGWTGSEQPPPSELVDLLLRGFRLGASTGEYRAVALVKDVRVRDSDRGVVTDAVCVTLEHEEGTAIRCYLPYEKTPAGYAYGEVFADPAEASVFAAAPEQS